MSKKELLIYLGKNPSDRKLVDRMIMRWEVKKEWDTYWLIMDWVDGEDKTNKEDVEKSSEYVAISEDDREEYLNIIEEYKKEVWLLYNKIDELEQKNWRLEEKIEKYESNKPALDDSEDKGKKLEELKVNYEYLCKKNWRLKKWYEIALRLTYKYAAKNMNITKEEYEEQLSEEINRILEEEYGREE